MVGLAHALDAESVDFVPGTLMQLFKNKVGGQLPPGNRETGVRLLPFKGASNDIDLQAAVNVDGVAGNIGGWEKREPHDVVPVYMGH